MQTEMKLQKAKNTLIWQVPLIRNPLFLLPLFWGYKKQDFGNT